MEELIFFAVIIFFSILESIARSRRAKQKREQEGSEAEQFEWARTPPWEAELPTYDEDPSYDETALGAEDDVATERADTESEAASPRGILADILAELGGIATEETRGPTETVPMPRQSPPLPQPPPPVEVADSDEALTRRRPDRVAPRVHPIHLTHTDYGTDPSGRVASSPQELDPFPEALTAAAAAARAQLRGSRSALRQAIILREVLGPPLALRDEE